MHLGWRWCVKKGWCVSKHIGTHQRGPQHVREVMAGDGAYEGPVGHIWDGGSTLRRGRACQRAKAEGSIDEKGVRGSVVTARGVTARQRWAGMAVFSVQCCPHAPPRPCPTPIHMQPPWSIPTHLTHSDCPWPSPAHSTSCIQTAHGPPLQIHGPPLCIHCYVP